MVCREENIVSNKALRVLDPDLPLLATEAAIDIDNLISNRSKDMTAIHKLAELLKNSVKLNSAGSPHSLMDPATLTILSEAVAQAAGDNKIEKLLSEAVNIGVSLSSEDPMKSPAELERAREFCIALSVAVATYRKSIHDLRPMHPFRK
jgi:hypothetical protein